jgi:hypothetical protein
MIALPWIIACHADQQRPLVRALIPHITAAVRKGKRPVFAGRQL